MAPIVSRENRAFSLQARGLRRKNILAVIDDDKSARTCEARLAQMAFFLSLRDGRKRFNVVEYISISCVCPLCSASTSFGPHMMGDRPIGMFTTLPPPLEAPDATIKKYLIDRAANIRRHLASSHRPLMEHVLMGGQLTARAMLSPSIPSPLSIPPSRYSAGIQQSILKLPGAIRFLAPLPSLVSPLHMAEREFAIGALSTVLAGQTTSSSAVASNAVITRSLDDMMRSDFTVPGPRARMIITQHKGMKVRGDGRGAVEEGGFVAARDVERTLGRFANVPHSWATLQRCFCIPSFQVDHPTSNLIMESHHWHQTDDILIQAPTRIAPAGPDRDRQSLFCLAPIGYWCCNYGMK